MRQAEQAAYWREQAAARRVVGDDAAEIAALQRAAALLAAPREDGQSDDRARAEVCRRLADLLAEADRLPEAMQAWQEAADAYGRLPDGAEAAAACARRIGEGVRALRARPQDRLYLLIARHEREQRQLATQPDTEAAQADRAFHIATVLHRRGRFADAAARYGEALDLYARAPECGEQEALCHHRLGDLYDHDMDDAVRAFGHYRQAARLYAAHEPLSDGRQLNRLLCEQRLRDLSTNLSEFTDQRL